MHKNVCIWAENILSDFSPERVQKIVTKHFKGGQQQEFLREIDNIVERATDETLRLAVFGEFSSGKSTFINALMKRRLLKSSTEATTAVGTHIRDGKSFSITVTTLSGEKISATENDTTAMLHFFNENGKIAPFSLIDMFKLLSSDESIAQSISKIDLSVPCEFRIPNLEIIDTPGFNSGEKKGERHRKVTSEIAEDYADCGIVVIPASQANTAELLQFLKSSLGSYLNECVFVLSQSDFIDEDCDLDEFVDDVRKTLFEKLSLKEIPEVFPVNSQSELPDGDHAKLEKWKNRFVLLENTLFKRMTKNRSRILQNHLRSICTKLCKNLSSELQNKQTEAEDEKKFLNRNKICRIEEVTQKMLYETESILVPEFERWEKELKKEVERQKKSARLEISENIELSHDESELELLQATVEIVLLEKIEELESFSTEKNEELKKLVAALNLEFKKTFKLHYRDFPLIGNSVPFNGIQFNSFPFPSVDLSTASAYLEEEKRNANKGANYGTGVGAGIGLVFGGPLGAAGGAWLGRKIGRFLSEDSEEEKIENLKNKILPKAVKNISDIETLILAQIEQIERRTLEAFREKAHTHVREYGEKVGALLHEREEKILALKKQLTSIQKDLLFLEKVNFQTNK